MGIKGSGGLLDAFDNSIKQVLRINDSEYDFICEKATDDELNLIIAEELTFSDKRKLIITLDKYLNLYHD